MNLTEVICQHCQRKCRPSESLGVFSSWRCDYHGATIVEYLFDWGTDTLHAKVFQCRTKAGMFRAFFYYQPEAKDKFRIDKIKEIKGRKEGTPVISLDFHPNIEPESAPDKLPTYLLFS